MPKNTDIPSPGDPLIASDYNLIVESIMSRQNNNPEETIEVSILVILYNIGDRFAPVACVGGEWNGIKADVVPSQDIPKCPNGHVLFEGRRLTLGWVTPKD